MQIQKKNAATSRPTISTMALGQLVGPSSLSLTHNTSPTICIDVITSACRRVLSTMS